MEGSFRPVSPKVGATTPLEELLRYRGTVSQKLAVGGGNAKMGRLGRQCSSYSYYHGGRLLESSLVSLTSLIRETSWTH